MTPSTVRYIHLNYVSGASIARKSVTKAVNRGDIPNPKTCECVDCGKPAKCYDHRDYNRPLDVVPVCRPCNYRRGTAMEKVWDNESEFFGYVAKCKTFRIFEKLHGFDMHIHARPVLRKGTKTRQPKAEATNV